MKDKVLENLIGYKTVSGAGLAREYGVSRAAIWKAVEGLRREGYRIGGTPRQGYQLLEGTGQIRPRELGPLEGSFGCQVHYSREIGSTNDVAKSLGAGDAPEGTVVVAESQTAGRGRLGRTWWSGERGDEGNGESALFSLLLRPPLSPGEALSVTLLAAVAVAKGVEKLTGAALGIKWPNDLLWEERKVAGILCEMAAEADRVAFLVVGIGINVQQIAWPEELMGRATSLREIIGATVDRTALIRAILNEAEKLYFVFLKEGSGRIREEWLVRNVTLGRKLKVKTVRGMAEGVAVALGEDGSLLVDTGGEIKSFAAGEVTLGNEY